MNFSGDPKRQVKWRLGIYAAIAMTSLALLPQIHLWLLRGGNWQGTSVSFDFDEVAYVSYLNALIDGRPRRNDPYSGRDDSPERPLPESLHSIQFIPAYAIALPARAFGVSAGTAFVAVRTLSAFASTLALFWLLFLVTGDNQVAAAGAILVLCVGGIAGEPQNAWRIISFRGTGDTLPFLRSYVPSLVFPFFWLVVAFVWQALQDETQSERLKRSVYAGLILAALIFSYFFLWTAMLAWLSVIALLSFVLQRDKRRAVLVVSGTVLFVTLIAFVPYALLLKQRANSLDAAQLLTHSHAPIVSLPVVIGLLVLLVLAFAVRQRPLTWRTPSVLFTASLALLPAVTFNQQLLTGIVLQPVHYSRYVSNYSCVLALGLSLVLLFGNHHRTRFLRSIWIVTLVVFSWSVLEASIRSRRLSSDQIHLEQSYLVGRKLRELTTASASAAQADVIFSSDLLLSDALPNVTSQPVLWAPHLFVFSGTSANENRERLYQQLYYSGTSEAEFASLARKPSYLQLAIFGWERMNQKFHALPILESDVESETKLYRAYLSNFDIAQAASPRLSYVVVPANGGPVLDNLRRWYALDAGQLVGETLIYKVRLRS